MDETDRTQEKRGPGRPPLYETPEEFTAKAEEYFTVCKKEGRPLTVTGLALYLGFSSLQSLDDAGKRPGFSDPLKRAKLRVECGYEEGLILAKNAAGSIFALKNFGWRDKQEIDHTITGLDKRIQEGRRRVGKS